MARLPAQDDPVAQRVQRIRERDTAVVDTLDGYYAGFAEQMQQSYGEFRRTSYDEIDKEDRARSSARTRTILGAAAVAASILVPSSCSSNTTCNLESAARYAGAAGGVAAFLSGLKKYADAKTHAQAFGELAQFVPVRSRLAGGGSRGPQPEAHRLRRRAVPRMAPAAARIPVADEAASA